MKFCSGYVFVLYQSIGYHCGKTDFNSTYGSVGFMEHPPLFGTPQHLQGPY